MPIYDYLKMVAKQYTKEPVPNFLQYHAESIQFAIEIRKLQINSHESFLFRPHPSENCDIYDELFADSPNVFVSKEGTIQEVLVNTRTSSFRLLNRDTSLDYDSSVYTSSYS